MKILSHKKVYLVYILFFVAASISLVVSNISYDAEYEMAMGYRLIKGDIPILEMWEPNQTSAFLCAFIMKVYMSVTGTTTGIVLFVNFMGYLVRVCIAGFLYRTIQKPVGELPALLAGLLYILIGPKDILVPEYSNMELWFSTLTVLFLVQYLQKKKVWQLVLSAVCLFLGVLSYPSFILTYFVVLFFLWKQDSKKIRDVLVFTGVCAVLGISYVIYLLGGNDLETILNCLSAALAIEPTHTVSILEKLLVNAKSVASIVGVVIVMLFTGLVVETAKNYIQKEKNGIIQAFSKDRWLLFSWYALMFCFVINIFQVIRNGFNHYPLLFIVLFGFLKRGLLVEEEKPIYNMGLLIGLMTLISTVILSDHPFIHCLPYMMTAVVFSVIPLYRWFEGLVQEKKVQKLFIYGVHFFLLLVLFRAVYVHTPIQGRGQAYSIVQDMGLIRTGPAMGIITDEKGAAMQRDSYAEFQQYIQPGDTIWILGEPVDTLGYLYQDVKVGAPSVMSTPTYNEDLLYYWELNPEKYPDVVIVSSGFGTLSYEMLQCEWLMNWLEEEYQAENVIDGNYWRYYFKEAR